MFLMKSERAIEWANRVLFKSQSKEPMSAADSQSVAGLVWEGAANSNPLTNKRVYPLSSL